MTGRLAALSAAGDGARTEVSRAQEIGGVAGALAQHADATLDRIGAERAPIVRELLAKLRSLTNVRAIVDASSPTGYKIDVDYAAWRGWREPATW